MAGQLRGTHTTVEESEILTWLLKFGDVSVGRINNRRSNRKVITIKEIPDTGWITIKVMSGMAQELKYFHDQRFQYPWDEGNIPKNIERSFDIKNHLLDTLNESSDEEE